MKSLATKMMAVRMILVLVSALLISQIRAEEEKNIVIENQQMKLVISSKGKALSLVHKSSGQECLKQDVNVPAFTLTQYRPYDNEQQLSHPAKSKTYAADSVWWKDGDLIVSFKPERNVATIQVNTTDSYIGFKLKKFNYDFDDFREKRKTEIDEFTFLQLPVINRKNFGEWLNVSWDKDVAVNLIATDPFAKIDAEEREGYRIFNAGVEAEVKLEDVGAALIVTEKNKLLDCIDKVEHDFNLPKGVESRRSDAYKYSYYEVWDATPENIDKHIAYAIQGGFRAIQLSCTVFVKTVGHFDWNNAYPNGIKDLQTVVQKIKDAGMIAGIHIWYNKAEKDDKYITPVPDYRLNLSRPFILAAPLNKSADIVVVEENPAGCTLEEGRRILKIGDELIEYSGFTTERPFQFTGCKRGILGTSSSTYKQGLRFGLLDVDTWTKWVRFDQRTSIQQEVAERIGKIYSEAGLDFLYFDGAEDIHPPYWFYTSLAQLKVYNCLQPAPAFAEGALKSHFSWHIITRGNAFDVFAPEVVKQATNRYPLTEAALVSNDFTSIDFGWLGATPPGETTIGMQPDMYEYVCSRSAAWDCPISLVARTEQFEANPRTADNLDVIKRWEDARISGILSEEQKNALRNSKQEHILLKNAAGKYELYPYEQIDMKDGSKTIRAFVFSKSGKTVVVYWDTKGKGEVRLNLNGAKVKLYKESGDLVPIRKVSDGIVIPAGSRLFLESGTGIEETKMVFKNASIL